jgi:hypothetical protein
VGLLVLELYHVKRWFLQKTTAIVTVAIVSVFLLLSESHQDFGIHQFQSCWMMCGLVRSMSCSWTSPPMPLGSLIMPFQTTVAMVCLFKMAYYRLNYNCLVQHILNFYDAIFILGNDLLQVCSNWINYYCLFKLFVYYIFSAIIHCRKLAYYYNATIIIRLNWTISPLTYLLVSYWSLN